MYMCPAPAARSPRNASRTPALAAALAARREAWEEVGVATEAVEVVGRLTPIYIPPSRFSVWPLVAAKQCTHLAPKGSAAIACWLARVSRPYAMSSSFSSVVDATRTLPICVSAFVVFTIGGQSSSSSGQYGSDRIGRIFAYSLLP